eukprot:TRINITY_DN10594_c0_g1_i1.p1 TRINITY_DN10594_c0_g1~~TRINITY_DN10594_c0_g1_i1.p1  ORF type:complete len:485 (-),score=74.18 TRINITY_DN10594_c0_g1_i1:165-1619(-)
MVVLQAQSRLIFHKANPKQAQKSNISKLYTSKFRNSRAPIKCSAEEETSVGGGGLFSAIQEVGRTGTQFMSKVTSTIKISSSDSKRGGRIQPRDPNLVFVAGATGRTGSRVVRELLSSGFKVRGGVTSMDKATEFINFCKQYDFVSRAELKRLQFVEFDLEIPDTIGVAIGKSSRVVCCVGSSESSIDLSEPKRIEGDGTISLIKVSEEYGVQQFVLVTSIGTTKFSLLGALFNLYGGILNQKARAEKALQETLMEFTIIRPGGMEIPTDKYKETHNVKLAPKDTIFGGSVSRLQIAELVGSCISSPELAQNKILEVVAEEDAPKLSYKELLSGIESEELQADKIARIQEEERIQFEIEDTVNKIQSLQEDMENRQENKSALENQLFELQKQSNEQQRELDNVLQVLKQNKTETEQLTQQIDEQSKDIEVAEALLTAQKILMGEGRPLTEEEVQEVTQKVLNPEIQKEAVPTPKVEQVAVAQQA